MKKVEAYECYGIYADYNGDAPDTSSVCLVATKEVADALCNKLNENPRRYTICIVEGFEYAKSWCYREELTTNPSSVFKSVEEALNSEEFQPDDLYDGIEPVDGDGDEDC